MAEAMTETKRELTFDDIKGWLFSISMASAIVFGYGQHPTVDAIILTVVWIFLVVAAVGLAMLTGVIIMIRKTGKPNDKDFGKFYKSLSNMHKNILGRIVGFMLIAYWLYALVIQEWTVTAVFYIIIVIYTQVFIHATKDIAKDFFHNQLKGVE